MSKIWNFLKEENNRKVLSWLSAGLLALAAFWGLGVGAKKEEVKPKPDVIAPAKPEPVNPPAGVVVARPTSSKSNVEQKAIAGSGGVAINASDNAHVTVNGKP